MKTINQPKDIEKIIGIRENAYLPIDAFYNFMRRKMTHKNQTIVIIVCGPIGSGKSWSSLEIADRTSPRGITIQRNVVMGDNIRFMDKLVNKTDIKKADILIYDEGGASFSSRDFQTQSNKLIGSVLQTFRGMNVGVIFTVPSLSFIDVQARKLANYYMEAVSIDRKRKEVVFKLYEIQHNSKLDRTYYKSPVFWKDDVPIKVPIIRIPKPRQELIDEYEKVKSEYIDSHNREVLEKLKQSQQKNEEKREMPDMEIYNEVMKKQSQFTFVRAGKIRCDWELMMVDFKISRDKARGIKKMVERSLNGSAIS